MPSPAPCRLFVYLARDAPFGLVLRRGPSAWARLSLWHTDTDTVIHGQWLRGRVYERRCDLSPDGSLFVAFVRQNRQPNSWLPLSRPPWFTALALWFVGGAYCAGGFFPVATSLWLGWNNSTPDQGRLPPWLSLTPDLPHVDRTCNWTERTVWHNRLLRDGWRPTQAERGPRASWERRQPGGRLSLLMAPESESDFAAYGGPHIIEYGVLSEAGGELYPLGRVTWADWDQQGRLVVAQDGRLLHWQGPGQLRELADFTHQAPAPAAAATSAYVWPPHPPA